MALTVCGLQWILIFIGIGAVVLVDSVLFIVLTVVRFTLIRKQRQLILTLRRLLAEARKNQATSASQVQPPHPAINTDQQHHSSLDISEEPVYAVIQEDNLTLTTNKNVAYGQTSRRRVWIQCVKS